MMTPKIASSIAVLFLVVGCSTDEENIKELTVYVSADEQLARDVFSAFTQKTGIEVAWVGDTEASKTTALVQRLLREKEMPIADVFWSSEILGTIKLAQEGALQPCLSDKTQAWPKEYRDESLRWFAFSPRARVIAYDPNKIQRDELPKTWWEYGDAAMADPRFGTTRTHVSVMSLFPEKFSEFLASSKGTYFLGGNAATLQQVIDGTKLFAMTDTDDVHSAIERGESVAVHYPMHSETEGTLLIPNTVAIISGSEHEDLATEFVNYLLSDEIAEFLASSTSHNIPLQRTVADKFPELQVPYPLQVDYYKAAAIQEEAVSRMMRAKGDED